MKIKTIFFGYLIIYLFFIVKSHQGVTENINTNFVLVSNRYKINPIWIIKNVMYIINQYG